MPPCQFLFMQSVIVLMGLLVGAVGVIARLTGHSASRAALSTAIICAFVTPFLFYFRPAVYHGVPAIRDTSLGWPLIYAHAQSDASLDLESHRNLAIDVSIGLTLAAVLLIWHRTRHANVA